MPSSTPSTEPRRSWAIVGGGMLGITLALRLARAGQRVTLFESATELGGLASPWSLGDIVWDRHYHVTLLSDTRLRAFLEDLGLEREIKWVETKTGFYTDGKFHSMSNTAEFLRFPPLTLWQKLRLGGTIFLGSKLKNWRRLERIPVTRWLCRYSGKGVFQKIWLPLLRAKLGESYQRVSAAFIWSYISRMYKARRTGLKKEMFGYVPGGYARILTRSAEVLREAGVEIRLGQRVRQVIRGAGGEIEVTCGADQEPQRFDHVVLTCPAPVVAPICPQLAPEEAEKHRQISYLGIVCASVLLKRPLGPYYVTNITEDWVPLTAVIEMTTIVDPAELGGHSLVYLPKYAMPEDAVFSDSDQEIETRFLETLSRMYPDFRRDDVLAFRISRVKNVVALPTVNYSRKLPPMRTSVPGLFVVNSAYILKGNLNVNETIELAEDAFRDVLLPAMRRPCSAVPPAITPEPLQV